MISYSEMLEIQHKGDEQLKWDVQNRPKEDVDKLFESAIDYYEEAQGHYDQEETFWSEGRIILMNRWYKEKYGENHHLYVPFGFNLGI